MRYKSKETMQEIVKCIEEFFFSYNRAPSISEIAKEIGYAKSMVYKYLIEMNEKGYIKYDGTVIGTPTTSKADTGYTLSPIVGSVSCGEPQYEEENFESYVALPDSLFGKEPHFILRASGTSMIEAGISPGDLVVVKKQNTANEGDIIVALVDGESTLKRFFYDEERQCVRLHPENRRMKDIYVRNCYIQGVAQKVIKDLA